MLRTRVAVTLAHVDAGAQATIIELLGGSDHVGRLAALGFTPGVTLDVLRNPGHGPIIVSLLDTQIALGRGEARRVMVYPRR